MKYQLSQWQAGERVIHEKDIDEDSLEAVLEEYEELLNNLGTVVYAVGFPNALPKLQLFKNGVLNTTLFVERMSEG